MSTHPHIDRICAVVLAAVILLAALFVNGEALGLRAASKVMGYETRLFDTSRVHTIEIVMDNWEDFIETCENEEYTVCSVVIDNEAYKNIGIRAKGNTSLSMVSSLGSDRYSFKLEFDQYDGGKTYYGLDKLCLNNIIQDNTYMKDYLTYQMMGAFGVNAPLCSYVYITVNGEDWGLYLAVEGVEDSFLQRNYGKQFGDLYKPDSTSLGGGRGNGRDFDMEEFMEARQESEEGNTQDGGRTGPPEMPEGGGGEPRTFPDEGARPDFDGGEAGMPGRGGGIGSDDVKLQYCDDDPESYSNIFASAKTDVSEADQTRLIQALKALSEGREDAVDADQVLRYFVVHNYVVNGDSYTGSIVHNYYLYEQDGRLSMIPWDYNLAFGTFQGQSASQAVNDPIDTPLSVTGSGDRPMIDWILNSEEHTQLYHQYFEEFLEAVDPAAFIDKACELIAPYVEKDPTKFCTYEEFEAGVTALKDFCRLRSESVSRQLAGTIPSTSEGQSADNASLVDASSLTISDMGTMNSGGGPGGGGPGGFGQRDRNGFSNSAAFSGEAGGRDGAFPVFGEVSDAGEGMDFNEKDVLDGGIKPPEATDGGQGPAAKEAIEGEGVLQPASGQKEMPGDGFPPSEERPGDSAALDSRTYALLGLSVLLLAAGTAAASRYQRQKRFP